MGRGAQDGMVERVGRMHGHTVLTRTRSFFLRGIVRFELIVPVSDVQQSVAHHTYLEVFSTSVSPKLLEELIQFRFSIAGRALARLPVWRGGKCVCRGGLLYTFLGNSKNPL